LAGKVILSIYLKKEVLSEKTDFGSNAERFACGLWHCHGRNLAD
jgi:hypothetical protein